MSLFTNDEIMFNSFTRFFSDVVYHVSNDKHCTKYTHKLNRFVCIIINRFLLSIRWKVIPVKAEEFKNHSYNPDYGILFISNHTSNMDGNLIYWALIHMGYYITIWAHDFVFKLPYIGWAISSIRHVKVPNIPSRRNPRDRKAAHKAIVRTVDGLKQGDHFLFFPSGSSKKLPREHIGGKSGVHQILTQIPDVNIVLIRHKGMWGSRFSWAAKRNPNWKSEKSRWHSILWDYLKMFGGNLILFTPRREFKIELTPAPPDFPRHGTRKEINRWLENYFNEGIPEDGEPVNAVNDYFWKEDFIDYQCTVKEYLFDSSQVELPIKSKVVDIIASKAGILASDVKENFDLNNDVGLDSLEIIEVLEELETLFDLPTIIPGHVTTVGHLMAIAAKIPVEVKLKEIPLKVEKQKAA